jgi:hypothetical protein
MALATNLTYLSLLAFHVQTWKDVSSSWIVSTCVKCQQTDAYNDDHSPIAKKRVLEELKNSVLG